MNTVISMPIDRECFSIDEMADQLGTTRTALAMLRSRGGGPPYIKVGNTIAYPIVAFRVWALRQTGLGGTP